MLKSTLLSFVRNRELIWEMTRRDLKGMTKGAILGYLWLIINPLIQVFAYVFIVSFIFRVRLNPNANVLDYALYVLSGLIPWQIVTRVMTEAPSLVRDRTDLLKQVIYPIETLPLTNMIVTSFGSIITLLIFILLSLFMGELHWTCLLLPIPFLLLIVFSLGVSWLFSIAGVIVKDLREMIFIIMGLLVYFSPVVASESMVGNKIWSYILFNPLAHIVIVFRDVFFAEFHLWSWVIFVSMALIVFILGAWVITRAKIIINEYI